MKITKKHKLYFRTSNQSIRRLDKTVPQIYMFILNAFTGGDAEKRYSEKNKDVSHWSNYRSITLELPEDHEISFGILQNAVDPIMKKKKIEISYNGTWRPLVMLEMKSKTKL